MPFNALNSELAIKPVLEIKGPQKVYEGDQLFLTCNVNSSLPSTKYVNLLLKQGTKFLSEGYPKVNHSSVVLAEGQADFKCELDIDRVVKTASKNIPVAGELLCCLYHCKRKLFPITSDMTHSQAYIVFTDSSLLINDWIYKYPSLATLMVISIFIITQEPLLRLQ